MEISDKTIESNIWKYMFTDICLIKPMSVSLRFKLIPNKIQEQNMSSMKGSSHCRIAKRLWWPAEYEFLPEDKESQSILRRFLQVLDRSSSLPSDYYPRIVRKTSLKCEIAEILIIDTCCKKKQHSTEKGNHQVEGIFFENLNPGIMMGILPIGYRLSMKSEVQQQGGKRIQWIT
jgi:hypothetical protein